MSDTTLQHDPPALSAPKGLRMLYVNQVRLCGRLTHDPKTRSAKPGKVVVHLNLAVNRRYRTPSGQWRQDVFFVPITVWNTLAQYCTSHMRKGSPLYIEGRLRSDRWKTNEGRSRCDLKVEAVKVKLLT